MLVSDTHVRPPTVSVIVPAYNSGRTIGRCVEALVCQTAPPPYEVLVVHSGTDDTCRLAERAHPAVRTVQMSERAIPPRARNVGVASARGRIFAFVDSDIYVDRDWVARVLEIAERDFDLVCGCIENANPDSAVARAEQLLMFNEFLPDHPEHPSWFALSGNTVMRRDAYERFGPFAEVRAAEDVVFSRRLVARGGRILFAPQLRVRHDNRTALRPFLRNQRLVGRHTAMARRLVSFADSDSRVLVLAALPVAPAVKLAKIALHAGRYRPMRALAVLRELPMLTLGAVAYSLGLCQGTIGWTSSNWGDAMVESPNSNTPASGPTPAQGR